MQKELRGAEQKEPRDAFRQIREDQNKTRREKHVERAERRRIEGAQRLKLQNRKISTEAAKWDKKQRSRIEEQAKAEWKELDRSRK